MRKSVKIRLTVAISVILLLAVAVCSFLVFSSSAEDGNIYEGTLTNTFDKTELVERLLSTSQHYIVMKGKQLGGTHYAYTEAVSENKPGSDTDKHTEYNFNAGAEMVILSVLDNGDGTVSTYEKSLYKTNSGMIRDPSVSSDGKKVLFSLKKNSTDDFHIYEMDLTDGTYPMTQLTFGNGRADIEPQYLPNGNIVFSSTRDTQTVDCWITPVSNLYIMNGDGSAIRRVGYDQVHTTYPTVTSDGRVLYTRWDYNDRTQMYIQGVFQMFQDGTNQTEVWGNDSGFPTTLLHTRDIPGAPGKYISIGSGHHVQQKGKLVIVDSTKGRNEKEAVTFVFPDAYSKVQENVDAYLQDGRAYKYPYALDENTILVSSVNSYTGKNSPYSIYLCDANESFSKGIELVKGTATAPATQIVPLKSNKNFNRASSVDYSQNQGTYYVANVYEGESMKGVAVGTAKYLRVVEIVYRSSAIGATYAKGTSTGGTGDPFSPIATGNGSWDVKAVLGVVPVEEDGSVLFTVPSETPVYFQLLDKDGCVIQTMRSWSTLMPGETFSCVGCHENKNTAPASGSGVTLAMKKGVQTLQKDLWMADYDVYKDFDPYTMDSIGFSYTDMVQSIFDESCITCHSNTTTALAGIKAQNANADDSIDAMGYPIPMSSQWEYTIGGKSGKGYAPFGNNTSAQTDVNTKWNAGTLTLKNSFLFTEYNKEACTTQLELKYSGTVTVKINGSTVFTGSSSSVKTRTVVLTAAQVNALKIGLNNMEVTVSGGTYYFDGAFRSFVPTGNMTLIEKASTWKYITATASSAVDSTWYSVSFDDSSWSSGKAPFGDRGDVTPMNTDWSGSNSYIWLRQEFNLTADELASLTDGALSLNIFYDDTIDIYINGTKVFSKTNWIDSYQSFTLSQKPQNVFKEGKNIIAVSLHNTGGGRAIDLALKCQITLNSATSDAPFSLAGNCIAPETNRMRRVFPVSYLLLTGSEPSVGGNQVSGIQWIGKANNKYTSWISTMSGAKALKPYSAGSFKSALILKLRQGHGNLTENQIRTIECWIDLAVPCFGTYDENEVFVDTDREQRNYDERINKRHFYDIWDKYVKMDLGGILPSGTIEATYTPKKGDKITGKDEGYLILNVGKYSVGDKITVKVTGSKYVAISINERQGESLLYVPGGEFTYTVPTDLTTAFNTTYRTIGAGYESNTIFLRIPTEEELSEERNLAVNTYDSSSATGTFPHVTANGTTTGATTGRCAIDGFVTNTSAEKKWPYQAWMAQADVENSFKLDFGREVKVNELQIKLRSASTDTHLLSAKLTFSDGSSQTIYLHNTSEFMTFDLGGKTVSSITLSNFEKADASGLFGITELRVFGTEK